MLPDQNKERLRQVLQFQIGNSLSHFSENASPSADDDTDETLPHNTQFKQELFQFRDQLVACSLANAISEDENAEKFEQLRREYAEFEIALQNRQKNLTKSSEINPDILFLRTEWLLYVFRKNNAESTKQAISEYLANTPLEFLQTESHSTIFRVAHEMMGTGYCEVAVDFVDAANGWGRPGSLEFFEEWIQFLVTAPSEDLFKRLFTLLDRYEVENHNIYERYKQDGFPDPMLEESKREFDWIPRSEFQVIVSKAEVAYSLSHTEPDKDPRERFTGISNVCLRITAQIQQLKTLSDENNFESFDEAVREILEEIVSSHSDLSLSTYVSSLTLMEEGLPETELNLFTTLELHLKLLKKVLSLQGSMTLHKILISEIVFSCIELAGVEGDKLQREYIEQIVVLCSLFGAWQFIVPKLVDEQYLSEEDQAYWFAKMHESDEDRNNLDPVLKHFRAVDDNAGQFPTFRRVLYHKAFAQGHVRNWKELLEFFIDRNSSMSIYSADLKTRYSEEELDTFGPAKTEFFLPLDELLFNFALLAAYLNDTASLNEILEEFERGKKFLELMTILANFEQDNADILNLIFRV